MGQKEISGDDMITFPEGLIGFQSYHNYKIVAESDESPFRWLRSVDDESLSFVVIRPDLFLKKTYAPSVGQGDLEALGVQSINDCSIFVIVTIPQTDPEKMTANLQGPILINSDSKIGRQAISANDAHVVRYPVLGETEN